MSSPVTFLVCGFADNKDLKMSLLVTLFPKDRKVALFFINPMIRFEEEKLEKLGSDAVNILSSELEKITNHRIDYKFSITENHFLRIIDILGGVPIYFDPGLVRKNLGNFNRQVGKEYVLSGEEISDFLSLKNPENPEDYLERLYNQETLILIMYDHIVNSQKSIKKEWLQLFANFFDTDLRPEEFISLFHYIIDGHLIVYISEMPAEPVIITDGKVKKVYLKVKEEIASIAYNKFESDLRSEDFADGEFARIEILNGTEINGLAKRAKSLLNEKRVKVLSTDNAWVLNLDQTIIIDRSGNPEYSYKISDILGIRSIKHIIDKEVGLDSTIILGEDFEIKPGKK